MIKWTQISLYTWEEIQRLFIAFPFSFTLGYLLVCLAPLYKGGLFFQTSFSLFVKTISIVSQSLNFLLYSMTAPILSLYSLLWILYIIFNYNLQVISLVIVPRFLASLGSISLLFIFHYFPFFVLVMAHIGKAPINIIDITSGYNTSSTTRIINSWMPNVNRLEFNQHVTNLIVLGLVRVSIKMVVNLLLLTLSKV